MHLTPAAWAIRCFGGPTRLAKAIGVAPPAPFQWSEPRRGGRSYTQPGDIPGRHMRRILDVAHVRGLDITEHDLIYGREVEDPPAVPAAVGV